MQLEEVTPRRVIGGSNAASVLGLGRDSSLSLYMQLRGEMPEREKAALPLRAGSLAEPMIRQLVKEDSGYEIVNSLRGSPCSCRVGPLGHYVLTHPTEPRIIAHPDGEIVGKPWLAELKLAGQMRGGWGETGSVEVPRYYFVQVQHGMALARATEQPVTHTLLCVLFVAPWELRYFLIPEDQEAGKALLEAELAFLRRVDAGDPPDPTTEAEVRARWAATQGKTVKLPIGALQAITELKLLKQQIGDLEKQADELKLAVIKAAEDNTELLDQSGNVVATFRPSREFSEAVFKEKFPELHNRYSITTSKLDTETLRKLHKAEVEKSMVPGQKRSLLLKKD